MTIGITAWPDLWPTDFNASALPLWRINHCATATDVPISTPAIPEPPANQKIAQNCQISCIRQSPIRAMAITNPAIETITLGP